MNTIYRWIGRTILIHNYKGDGLTRLVRVHSIRDTWENKVLLKTHQRNIIQRGRYLIVGTDLDRNVVRSYYVQCSDVREIGWVGRQWHKVLCKLGLRLTKDNPEVEAKYLRDEQRGQSV